jgi:hypothetical protein
MALMEVSLFFLKTAAFQNHTLAGAIHTSEIPTTAMLCYGNKYEDRIGSGGMELFSAFH